MLSNDGITEPGQVVSDITVAGNVVTVSSEVPCRLCYLSDGEYVPITAVESGEGSYSFDVPDGVGSVILVVKGDSNHDGKLSNADSTKIKAYIKGLTTLTDLQVFAADANGDGKLSNADSTKIKAVIKGLSSLSW